MSTETLQRQLTFARKQKAYAWAQFYSVINTSLHSDHEHLATYQRTANEPSIPEHIKSELRTMATALQKKWECPCCLDMIEDGDLEITNCGHYYCKACLEAHKKTQKDSGAPKWECATCRRKHNFKEDE